VDRLNNAELNKINEEQKVRVGEVGGRLRVEGRAGLEGGQGWREGEGG
jgi:hypothetical protein